MAVQLAARGQQDVYITGKPSITYFNSLYQRHTPFVKETIGVNFDTPVTSGLPLKAQIVPRGHMVTDITFKLTLPTLYQQNSINYCWPVYPSDMTSTMPVYIVSGGVASLALEVAPSTFYYSTTSMTLWATRYADVFPNFDFGLAQFYMTTTTSTAIYFKDATSAAFWGFDTRGPDSVFVDAVQGTLYGFTVTANIRYGNFTASQSGWIQGNQPIVTTGSYFYYDSPIERVIQNATLYIGGQAISTVTGAYIDIYNDQNVTYENQSGLTFLTGKKDSSIIYAPRTYYTKLPFGLENIPMCALSRNDVRVDMTLNPLTSLTLPAYNNGFLDFVNGWASVDMRSITGIGTAANTNVKVFKNYLVVDDGHSNNRSVYTENSSFSSGWTVYPNKALGITRDTATAIMRNNLYYMNGQYLTYEPMMNYVTNINNLTTSTYGILSEYGGFVYVDWINYDARYIYICVSTLLINLGTSGLWVRGQGYKYTRAPYTNIGFPYATIITNKQVYDQTYLVYGRTAATLTVTERNELVAFVQNWGDYPGSNPTCTYQSATTSGSNVQVVIRLSWASPLTGDDNQNDANNMFNIPENAHIVVRYDTTASINSSTSYSYYRPFSSIFPTYSKYSWEGIQWQSILGQYDGRYILNGTSQGGYSIVYVDTQNFMSAVGYGAVLPYKPIYQKLVLDGKWVYTTAMFFDHTIRRYRQGTPAPLLTQAAYWEVYDSQLGPSPLPWPTIIQQDLADVAGGGPGGNINPTPTAFDGTYMYFLVTGMSFAEPIILSYDTTKPFTLSSSWSWFSKHWAARIGISFNGIGNSLIDTNIKTLTVDSNNNLYVCGTFLSKTFNITNPNGTVFTTLSAPCAWYVAKYNSSGVPQWVIRCDYNYIMTFGVRGIKVDSAGNLYVYGCADPFRQFLVYNSDGTQSAMGLNLKNGSCTSGEAFLMKFNSSGIWQWGMNTYGFFGPASNYSLTTSVVNEIAIDSTGTNLYAVGTSYGPYGQNQIGPQIGFILTGAASAFRVLQLNGVYGNPSVISGCPDAFVMSMTTAGVFRWVCRVSSSLSIQYGLGVTLDASDNPYFCGYTSASTTTAEDGAGLNPITLSGYAGGTWIARYTQAGVPSWMTGLAGATTPIGMVFNGTNIFIYGCFTSSITAGTTTRGTSGGMDIFVASCTTAGTVNNGLVTIGGNYDDTYPLMARDASGNLYLTAGWLSQTLTMTDVNGTQTVLATNDSGAGTYYEIILVKLNSGQTYGWSSRTAGARDNAPAGLALDSLGNIYLNGYYYSSPLTVYNSNGTVGISYSPASTQLSENSGYSFSFLAKYSPTGTITSSSFTSFGYDEYFISSAGIIPGIYFPYKSGGWDCAITQRYIYFIQVWGTYEYADPIILRIDFYFQNLLTATYDASLIVEYAHLSEPEVNWFRNNLLTIPLEYIQSQSLVTSTGRTDIPLLFKNPVKELLITGQLAANQNTYTYSNFDRLTLTLNGEDLFNNDGILFNTIIPYESSILAPTRNVYVYRFDNPVNLSRIAEKILKLTQTVGSLNTVVYAKTLNILGVQNGTASIIFT